MKLSTGHTFLRSLELEDSDNFYDWSQDREVTQYSLSAYNYPQSKAKIQKWLSAINDSRKTISFGICCSATNELIGYAGIASISELNRCGEYFILIGNKQYWRKGIGTEVTKAITHYGFNTLGLHRIELTAFAKNPSVLNAYLKAGYKHEGVLRQSAYRDGQFMDKVIMSVLIDEFSTAD